MILSAWTRSRGTEKIFRCIVRGGDNFAKSFFETLDLTLKPCYTLSRAIGSL